MRKLLGIVALILLLNQCANTENKNSISNFWQAFKPRVGMSFGAFMNLHNRVSPKPFGWKPYQVGVMTRSGWIAKYDLPRVGETWTKTGTVTWSTYSQYSNVMTEYVIFKIKTGNDYYYFKKSELGRGLIKIDQGQFASGITTLSKKKAKTNTTTTVNNLENLIKDFESGKISKKEFDKKKKELIGN